MTDNLVTIKDSLYEIVRSSLVIEAPSKKGTKYWAGHIVKAVFNDPSAYYTCTEAWSTTKDGFSKHNWSVPFYAEPKNVGRSNETTSEQQATLEFESMVQKELDKRNSDKPLPMLAQTYDDPFNPKKGRKKYIKFPAYVQPKYDGMRMLYDGNSAWSRGSKEIIPEVIQHLHFNTEGCVIDGELILLGNLKVNEVMKATKKFREGVSNKLVYRVYDIVDTVLPFSERFEVLSHLVKNCNNTNIILSTVQKVHSDSDIKRWHGVFVEEGYEGTMIRNTDGLYTINQRSNDLQKYKDFVTEEFLITDIIPSGSGSAEFVGKYVCVTDEGNPFESTATGDESDRIELLENKDNYIGKYAVVKYRERSGATNVPFHSNVLEVRDTKKGGY